MLRPGSALGTGGQIRPQSNALPHSASLPRLGFAWREVKVTTVFHNGCRQCETSIFTSSAKGESTCQDRKVTHSQLDAVPRSRGSRFSHSLGSNEKRPIGASSRPSSSAAARPVSAPATKPKKRGSLSQQISESKRLSLEIAKVAAADAEQEEEQSTLATGHEQQMPDSLENSHGSPGSKTQSITQLSTSAITPGQITGTEQPVAPRSNHTEESAAQAHFPSSSIHHKRNVGKAPPAIWDDLIYLGTVDSLPVKKDPKDWPTHLWPKIRLGLSKHGIFYQIGKDHFTKRICALVTGREPALVRYLAFPSGSTKNFTLEIQPVEGEAFVFACDAEDFLDDWLREIQSILTPYQEWDPPVHERSDHGPTAILQTSVKPDINQIAINIIKPELQTLSASASTLPPSFAKSQSVPAPSVSLTLPSQSMASAEIVTSSRFVTSSRLAEPTAPTQSINFVTSAEIVGSGRGLAEQLQRKAFSKETSTTAKAFSKETSTTAEAKDSQGSNDAQALRGHTKHKSLKTMTTLRDIKAFAAGGLGLKGKTRTSLSSGMDEDDDGGDTMKMQELPRIAQAYQIPMKDLQDIWKEYMTFTGGQTEIARENFASLLAAYLKVPRNQIPHHLLLRSPVKRKSVMGDTVGFEEFVLWHKAHEFDPFLTQDEKSRFLQIMANEWDLPLPDVEAIKKQFDHFDTDRSGFIEFDEFVSILAALLQIKDKDELPQKRIERYWSQMAGNESSVGFEDFLPWYAQNFYCSKGTGTSAITYFYASFGVNRLKH